MRESWSLQQKRENNFYNYLINQCRIISVSIKLLLLPQSLTPEGSFRVPPSFNVLYRTWATDFQQNFLIEASRIQDFFCEVMARQGQKDFYRLNCYWIILFWHRDKIFNRQQAFIFCCSDQITLLHVLLYCNITAVSLWIEYCTFAIGLGDTVKCREIMSKAIESAAGSHLTDGKLLYDLRLEYEQAILATMQVVIQYHIINML
mgnify:CR=1 FL=1